MVRQVETEKSRRSNMAYSSINAAPKKGGAGGCFTWGVDSQETGYEPYLSDMNNLSGVTVVPRSEPILNRGLVAPFDVQLEDQNAFPFLPTSAKKMQQDCDVGSPALETASEPEPADEWVIVMPPGADSLRQGALDIVDGQHPRNLFAKKPSAKKVTKDANGQDRSMAIDWSQMGIPQEVKKQIVQAYADASHRSPYVKEQASTLPLDMLRSQNAASNHRSNSASRARQNSVPRSRSKPRMTKQSGGRC